MFFRLKVDKFTRVFFFFFQERIKEYSEGRKSCGNRSNQASFQKCKMLLRYNFFKKHKKTLGLALESAPGSCRYSYLLPCTIATIIFRMKSSYTSVVLLKFW